MSIILTALSITLRAYSVIPIHMDWMGLEKIEKKFDLFGIQTHSGLVRLCRIGGSERFLAGLLL
jgi:hypothetical protein